MSAPGAFPCGGCGVELQPGELACRSCRRLVHCEELKTIAAEAEQLESAGDASGALAAWRRAMPLIPPEAKQFAVVQGRVERLSQTVAAAPSKPTPTPPPAWAKRFGPFGVVIAFIWKLKFVALAILSKGKLLLLGLTKASTVLSMLVSMGAYWALFGWRFAVGLVGSIYVHEMGHVAAMRQFGMPATAPMFIPGFGAFVRLKAYPINVVENARIGLAGPVWGLGAALTAFGIGTALESPAWLAIAHVGAWMNLFNLLPVWQLDGSRAFSALARSGRVLIALAFGGIWYFNQDGLYALLAIVAGARAFARDAPLESDRQTLIQFLVLIVVLGAVAGNRTV